MTAGSYARAGCLDPVRLFRHLMKRPHLRYEHVGARPRQGQRGCYATLGESHDDDLLSIAGKRGGPCRVPSIAEATHGTPPRVRKSA